MPDVRRRGGRWHPAAIRALSQASFAVVLCLALPVGAAAQSSTRLAILQAEDRRAPKGHDLSTLRSGARSGDGETAMLGLRAIGRLERPALIPDLVAGLRHRLPEVRAEAANAVAQAAQGLRIPGTSPMALAPIQAALAARLAIDDDAEVRAAVCESLGRMPYTSAADVARAESALTDFAAHALTTTDRLGLAKGLEALTRLQQAASPLRESTVDLLRTLARGNPERTEQELLRDARVRRLALDALVGSGLADEQTISIASHDPDAQVRRLAVRASTIDGTDEVVNRGLGDPAPMVRIEALRTARLRKGTDACAAAVAAADDPDANVALVALDQLGSCGHLEQAVSYLSTLASAADIADAPRAWHRTAHALVALATAAPEAATRALPATASAQTWQLREYAARAAAILGRRDLLEQFARDEDDNVAEAALLALSGTAGHDADAVYAAALARQGYPVVRAAALALDHSPSPALAIGPLKRALEQAEDDGRPGAADARFALRTTLASLGSAVRAPKPSTQPAAPLNLDDLRRLAAPRARITMHDAGVFDLALFTLEAPATVLRFVQLARSGYYDGLTFHRVVPNSVIQGGSPGANEYVSDAPYMRDEVGRWPHVRGAVGISTRGRDTGDGQFFVDLVDNPRYDHTYTVFAQVLNGMDAVDRIVEGDVIDRVEIIP